MTLRDVFQPAPPRVPSNPEWSDEGALTAAQRDTLEAALERGSADIAAGRVVDAREFLAKLSIP
jgi:predicted transcriptional regulator